MMPGAPYTDADRLAGAKLVERLGLLHTDRLAQEARGAHGLAVRDAVLINDLVDDATPAQLRAALIHATTPELTSLVYVPGGAA